MLAITERHDFATKTTSLTAPEQQTCRLYPSSSDSLLACACAPAADAQARHSLFPTLWISLGTRFNGPTVPSPWLPRAPDLVSQSIPTHRLQRGTRPATRMITTGRLAWRSSPSSFSESETLREVLRQMPDSPPSPGFADLGPCSTRTKKALRPEMTRKIPWKHRSKSHEAREIHWPGSVLVRKILQRVRDEDWKTIKALPGFLEALQLPPDLRPATVRPRSAKQRMLASDWTGWSPLQGIG